MPAGMKVKLAIQVSFSITLLASQDYIKGHLFINLSITCATCQQAVNFPECPPPLFIRLWPHPFFYFAIIFLTIFQITP